MNGITAKFQRREDIGTNRVTNHQKFFGTNIQMLQQQTVFTVGLVAHYLDVMEKMLDTRAAQFLLLVEQVAFGHNNQTVTANQRIQCLLHSIQQFYRLGELFLSQGQDLLQYACRDFTAGDTDSRFRTDKI